MSAEVLGRALAARQRLYSESIDQLRRLASSETENEVHDVTARLREAIELVGCLRRMVAGRTVAEIHHAFGAPGDFGYDTPIGDALAGVYKAVKP